MPTVEKPPAVDQVEADRKEIDRLFSEGTRVTDPDLRRRIQERADRVRQEMFEKHGLTNIAAELIREVRDE